MITDSDPDLLLGILRRHGEVQLCHRVVVHGAADAEIAPWLQHQPSGARAWKLGWGLRFVGFLVIFRAILIGKQHCSENAATATVGYNLYNTYTRPRKDHCEGALSIRRVIKKHFL